MESAIVSNALATINASVVKTEAPPVLVPWRDPHTVPPRELTAYIEKLEQACLDQPRSADLRTCLGMAYAMNYQVDESMLSLETAVALEPDNFWAKLKHAELQYRLRILDHAEAGSLQALQLAGDHWQMSLARKQLQQIRALKQGCVRNVEWTKPLTVPALTLSLMLALVVVFMTWG